MCYNYKKIVKALNSPSSIILKILAPVSKLLSDEFYLNLLFKKRMGYQLDLNNPVTFNEKIQWLKINYRKPEFANMVDKWEVKSIISKKIGSQYITKGYGVWDSFDVINFDVLPNKFVLKTTHSSGGIVKVKNKNSLDKKNARKILNNRFIAVFFEKRS